MDGIECPVADSAGNRRELACILKNVLSINLCSQILKPSRTLLVFALSLVIGASSFGQGRPQRPRAQRPGANPNDKNAAMVMPNFHGVLKGIDKKFLLLETEDGNEQKVNLTKKTKYFDGEKTISWGDLKVGDQIAAEVMLAPDRSFDGVNIRVDRKK